MKTRTQRILLVLGGLLVLGAGGVAWLGYTLFSPNSSRNRASAINCTLAWGRLAPFPASTQDFSITTGGGIFSRSFRVSFIAPAADLENWLRQSPGPQGSSPSSPSPGVRHFEVAPGGGAQHAEVTVDDTTHRVFIYVYWS